MSKNTSRKKKKKAAESIVDQLNDREKELLSQFIMEVSRFGKKTKLQASRALSRMTNRELDVLRCLAQDYSAQQTANELGITTTTIAAHRQSIKAKLGVRGLAGMTRFAIRVGLIDP